MSSLSKMMTVCVLGSSAGSLIYLFGGSFWGGIAIGSIMGLLVTSAFPRLIGYIRGQSVPAIPNHLPIGYVLTIIAISSILTFLIVHAFQPYTPSISRVTNVSLTGDDDFYGLNAVEWDGQRYVAVGWHKKKSDAEVCQDGAVWESADGYTWRRITRGQEIFGGSQLPDGKFNNVSMNAIRPTENGSLIFGSDSPDGNIEGRIWRLRNGHNDLERADDVTLPSALYYSSYDAHGNLEVLAGADSSNVLTWSRRGTEAWRPVSLGPLGQVDIYSVRYLNGQWIMAGFDKATDPDFQKAREGEETQYMTDAAVWTSGDGEHWSQSSGFSDINGAQQANDVTYENGMWIAIGQDDFGDSAQMDAAVWVSDDAKFWHRLEDRTLSGAAGWQSMVGLVVNGGTTLVVGDERPSPGSGTGGAAGNTSNAVWEVELRHRSGSRSPFSVARQLVREVISWFR